MTDVQNIICYLRRSRQDLERERKTGEDTLSTQKKIMTKILDDTSRPYELAEEIGSGDKIETRPVFQQVLRWLRQERFNAIAVKEIARLGRGSYSDMGEIFDLIQEKRIYIITPYKVYDIENPADARQIRFELFFAREEFEMIKERMQSSKLSLAHEGRWVVGATPLGYSINPRTTRLETVEEQASIVRIIFETYVYGIERKGQIRDVSFRAIATYLNNLGLPTPRNGSGWNYLTVQRILKNVAYIGTLKYRTRKRIGNKYYPRPKSEWIVVENAHEPIISRELWDLAQAKLGRRHAPHVKQDFNPCELAGLVICTKCGRRMVRQYSVQHYTKKDGTKSIYRKEFLWCTLNGCTFAKYRDIEKAILVGLAGFKELSAEQLRVVYDKFFLAGRESIDPQDIPGIVEKKKKDIQRRLDFIFDRYEKGVYSDSDFLRRKAGLERELTEIENLASSQVQLATEVKKENIVLEFKNATTKVLEVYKNTPDKTKRNELLRSVIDKVYLTKVGKGQYELDLVPFFGLIL